MMNRLRVIAFFSALVIASCSTQPILEVVPPDKFKAINAWEYPDYWEVFSDTFPTPDRADGDFDGDGKIDHARLWIGETGEGWVLMVYLSSKPEAPMKLYESTGLPWRRPIRTIKSGIHRTHRYYGVDPGGPDTTAVINLAMEAINLGRLESEGYTFVWNEHIQAFDRINMY